MIESAKGAQAGDGIGVDAFRFDLQSFTRPASFEIAFIRSGMVYEFGFSADVDRVWEEWLFVRSPGGRLQRWFSRSFDPVSERYEWSFGPSLRGPREMWRRATRPDALYVSTAVQFNSESLRPIVDWFRDLTVIDSDGISPEHTSDRLRTQPEFRARLIQFLGLADIPFSDIRVGEEEIDLDEVPADLREIILDRLKDADNPKIPIPEFGLPVAGSDTLGYLDFDELSDGTRRVYSLAATWLDVIEHGRIIVVDELECSLHPHLVRFLTGLINRPGRMGTQQAQLVVTMHDTVLLRDGLDRNQVWLTEKGADQAAWLTPLSSYRPLGAKLIALDRRSRDSHVEMILSVPCFEYWLLLSRRGAGAVVRCLPLPRRPVAGAGSARLGAARRSPEGARTARPGPPHRSRCLPTPERHAMKILRIDGRIVEVPHTTDPDTLSSPQGVA